MHAAIRINNIREQQLEAMDDELYHRGKINRAIKGLENFGGKVYDALHPEEEINRKQQEASYRYKEASKRLLEKMIDDEISKIPNSYDEAFTVLSIGHNQGNYDMGPKGSIAYKDVNKWLKTQHAIDNATYDIRRLINDMTNNILNDYKASGHFADKANIHAKILNKLMDKYKILEEYRKDLIR